MLRKGIWFWPTTEDKVHRSYMHDTWISVRWAYLFYPKTETKTKKIKKGKLKQQQ
jgi:hypothetical protein